MYICIYVYMYICIYIYTHVTYLRCNADMYIHDHLYVCILVYLNANTSLPKKHPTLRCLCHFFKAVRSGDQLTEQAEAGPPINPQES